MSGFNSSGRKEDVSTRLRAQNLKNAKDTTKKLEQDNRKMEERLRELKMAMNREKEERERQGGGFWQRGQTGTLNNYASEVLQDNSKKSASKKKKVKVLSDEPLDLPIRKGGPGTFKYIAQRGSPRIDLKKDNKNKGTKCGQCEDRAASLTCVQCSEYYCAGCFAAFHIKGALKRHRSVPLHATGPRQCMSPRPTPPASGRDSSGAGGDGTSGDVFYQQADRHGPSAASGSVESDYVPGGNSLFNGAYNEADSAASFQKALMAWRHGDRVDEWNTPRQAVVVSPVKSPVVKVESSTSTIDNTQTAPNIKFSSHSLTYAQRLMLKQHRRTELPSLSNYTTQSSTPTSDLTLVTPRSEVMLVSPRRAPSRRVQEDGEDVDEERVDFQALFEAMASSSHSPSSRVSGSSVTVIDVTDSPKEQRSASAESNIYTVEEITSMEVWEMEQKKRRLQRYPQKTVSQLPKESSADALQPQKLLPKSRETLQVLDKRLSKSRETTHVIEYPSVLQGSSDSSSTQSKVLSSKMPVAEIPRMEEEAVVPEAGKKPPPTAAARPKSAKSHPAARTKSARSRPGSRAQSRAASRLEGEGLLTKSPSSSLKEIARRTQTAPVQYHSPMEGFFLAGVQVEGDEERPQSRSTTPAQVKNIKVSNKLYAMSPRSWRPESTTGDRVPLESLGMDLSVGDKAPSPTVLHYTYSGQLDGHPVSWNPQESYGTPVPPEDAVTPVPRSNSHLQESIDLPANPPTPQESTDYPRDTPTPSSRQRKRWQTPDPDSRPFSAQRVAQAKESRGGDARQSQTRPNSSTGATEPKKRQARQLPTIDRDLEGSQKTRALHPREKSSEGWVSDDGSGDQAIHTMSAFRTRHWVESQNSSQWETEVQPFEQENSDLGMGDPGEKDADGNQVTPRPASQAKPRPGSQMTPRVKSRPQRPPYSARSSISRNSAVEESGRTSRAIVIDGEDLSMYDDDLVREKTAQNKDDMETLDKLEWELASESGRLTAEGKISRMSMPEVGSDGPSTGSRSGSRSSSVQLSYEQGYDINTKLRGDELSDPEEERAKSCMEMEEEEVRALH